MCTNANNDKQLTLNIFGGPGCGKSTIAAAVFSLLKMHGVVAELVTEFAKDLTWEERKQALANQYYIWGKQYHKMWRLKNKVSVIINDSPLLLNLVYGCSKPKCFHETVIDSFNEFDNINYFLNRGETYDINGRMQSKKEAIELDIAIMKILNDWNIEHKVVSKSLKGINEIIFDVLSKLGIPRTITMLQTQ
jgi:ABC-type dipeptide/oligopeptide/nickel transport system ATPase component